jgi:hypothetical protein
VQAEDRRVEAELLVVEGDAVDPDLGHGSMMHRLRRIVPTATIRETR